MSGTGQKILELFSRAIPKLSEQEKEQLLCFGEVVAFFAERTKSKETVSPQTDRPGA